MSEFDELSEFYNWKADMEKITKDHGGDEFFSELTAARIPFFFTAAVANTETDTEYLCQTITPSSMGISLTVDKFVDFQNIRNKGFVAIPSMEDISPSIQGLKQFDNERQKDGGRFYSSEVLAKFNTENGAMIEDESALTEAMDDETFVSRTAQNVLDSVMYNLSEEPDPDRKPKKEDDGQIRVSAFHEEPLVIEWGVRQTSQKDYRDEFAQIDKRHEGILKGDGSFLQVKAQETVYYNMDLKSETMERQAPEGEEGPEESEDTGAAANESP